MKNSPRTVFLIFSCLICCGIFSYSQDLDILWEVGYSSVLDVNQVEEEGAFQLIGGSFEESLFYNNQTYISSGLEDLFIIKFQDEEESIIKRFGDSGRDELIALGWNQNEGRMIFAFWDSTKIDNQQYKARVRSKNYLVTDLNQELNPLHSTQIYSRGKVVFSDVINVENRFVYAVYCPDTIIIGEEKFTPDEGHFYTVTEDEVKQLYLFASDDVRSLFVSEISGSPQLAGQYLGTLFIPEKDSIKSVTGWYNGFLFNTKDQVINEMKSLYDVDIVHFKKQGSEIEMLCYFTSYIDTKEFRIPGRNDERTYATFRWDGLHTKDPVALGYHDYDMTDRISEDGHLIANHLYSDFSLYQNQNDSIIFRSDQSMHLRYLLSLVNKDGVILEREAGLFVGEKLLNFGYEKSWLLLSLPKNYTSTSLVNKRVSILYPNPSTTMIYGDDLIGLNFTMYDVKGVIRGSGIWTGEMNIHLFEDGIYFFKFVTPKLESWFQPILKVSK